MFNGIYDYGNCSALVWNNVAVPYPGTIGSTTAMMAPIFYDSTSYSDNLLNALSLATRLDTLNYNFASCNNDFLFPPTP